MPCVPSAYTGRVDDAVAETNLNGQVAYTAARRWQPAPDGMNDPASGIAALVFAVAQTSADGRRLTPQGSRWSSMNLVQPDDGAVSLADLNRRLDYVVNANSGALTQEWRARQIDAAGTRRLIHVEAGMEIGQLCELLDANPGEPWALPTLGGANGQTLAGAISTSTHGGDWRHPPLPDIVRAMHLVTDGGRELWIEPDRAPITDDSLLRAALPCADTEIIRSDEVFDAALCAFGRFGVIYSFVLEVTLGFNVAEVVTLESSGPLLQAMREGANARNPLAPLLALAAAQPLPETLQVTSEVTDGGEPSFFQIVYSSQDPTQAWIERRWNTSNATLLNPPTGPSANTVAEAMRGIQLLSLAWDVGIDVGPQVNRVFASRFAPAMTEGLRGPHHLITSGTRESSHLQLAIGDSIEVVFDARNPGAAIYLSAVLGLARSFRQAGWISARPSRPSRATLSMHNFDTDLVWSIEITTIEVAPDRVVWMHQLHDLALRHGGRPHWGQHNTLVPEQVWQLYGKRLQSWHRALWRVSQDANTFSSDFTRRRGLDPIHVREVQAAFRTPSGLLTHLVGPEGAGWSPASVRDAIQDIRSGRAMYAIRSPQNRLVFIDVVESPNALGPYLRSQADGMVEDNLGQLPMATDTPPPAVADAQFVSQDIPGSVAAGRSALAHITMRNTGTSVWEKGRVLLASLPGSGLQFAPVPLPQGTSPLQEARFSISFAAGPVNTRATIQCRLLSDGAPFGEESDEATVVFVGPGEPADCRRIRREMGELQAKIAVWHDQLDADGNPFEQARLRGRIGAALQAVDALRQRGNSLGCTLPR